MRPFWRIGLVVLCGCAVSLCQQPSQSLQGALNQKLDKRMLSLRTPDPGEHLRFHSDGVAVDPVHGVVSLDRDLMVSKVKLSDGLIAIECKRVLYIWNSKTERLEANLAKPTTEIEIELPEGNVSEAEIAPIFSKVFESGSEREKSKCTPEETEESKEFLERSGNHHGKRSDAPHAKADLKSISICLPSGVRGYQVAKGITPPKGIETRDPAYDEASRRQKIQGTVGFVAVVDEKGQISDLLLVRPLDPKLNLAAAAAVRKWQFKPAMFQGEPIPAAIHIEVNFHLY